MDGWKEVAARGRVGGRRGDEKGEGLTEVEIENSENSVDLGVILSVD